LVWKCGRILAGAARSRSVTQVPASVAGRAPNRGENIVNSNTKSGSSPNGASCAAVADHGPSRRQICRPRGGLVFPTALQEAELSARASTKRRSKRFATAPSAREPQAAVRQSCMRLHQPRAGGLADSVRIRNSVKISRAGRLCKVFPVRAEGVGVRRTFTQRQLCPRFHVGCGRCGSLPERRERG